MVANMKKIFHFSLNNSFLKNLFRFFLFKMFPSEKTFQFELFSVSLALQLATRLSAALPAFTKYGYNAVKTANSLNSIRNFGFRLTTAKSMSSLEQHEIPCRFALMQSTMARF